MPKREVAEIKVSGKALEQLRNITFTNAAFSAQLTKYLNTWIAITFDNYQRKHGPVPKSELYQTYSDTQTTAKTGRKIPQMKKDKKDNTEKQVEVSPKAFLSNTNNLKILINYFLLKYAMELRHIYIANGHDFDRDYNEAQLENDAVELVLNPSIPFVLHVAKQFDAKDCEYSVTFEGMTSVKQIFKSADNGPASSTKKLEQFMNRFMEFVNVLLVKIFTISIPHKSLLHLEYVIGLLDLLNNDAGAAALEEDVLQDLHYYLSSAIKKPVKGTGKKTGKKAAAASRTEDPDEDNDNNNDDDDNDVITEDADYNDI